MVEFHPLADAFPLMEGEEFEQLVADIEKNGQLHPVMRFEGKILDGRNRYRACQRLGMKARQQEFLGDDPVSFVISENLARRHMDAAQRALAAEKLATAMQGRPRTKSPAGTEVEHQTTITEAATLMNSSPSAVKRVRKVRKAAVPEVVQAMDAGEITPTAAENLSTRSEEEQREIMTTATSPREVAAKANQVAKGLAAGVGRGRVGPKVQMRRQMDLPDLRVVQEIAADWEEHRHLIPDLKAEKVAEFLDTLKRSRTATTRLINLIEHGHVSGATAAAKEKAKAEKDGETPKAEAKPKPKRTAKPRVRRTPTGTTVSAVPDTAVAEAAAVPADTEAEDARA